MSAQPAPIETMGTLTFLQIPDSPYPLRRALTLEMEVDEEGRYVISEPSTGVFHYASDPGAAVNGFFRVFLSEFEFLRNNESSLSTPLSAELERFQQLFQSEPVVASA